jgi:hypothetical protein
VNEKMINEASNVTTTRSRAESERDGMREPLLPCVDARRRVFNKLAKRESAEREEIVKNN